MSYVFCFVCAFGCHLGDFGRHVGSQRVPKGGPEILFSVENQHKIEKNEIQEGVLKQHDLMMDF